MSVNLDNMNFMQRLEALGADVMGAIQARFEQYKVEQMEVAEKVIKMNLIIEESNSPFGFNSAPPKRRNYIELVDSHKEPTLGEQLMFVRNFR